ncbi:MAG: hypothetical protein ACT4NP_13975 [Pseudonocardiales bacterium]
MDTPKELLEELVKAVKQLAERPAPQPSSFDSSTAADRIRQRVAFSYQVLGTLTGRVSSSSGNEFDVRVVEACREPDVIKFKGLPPGADWAELRAGNKVEVLRIEDEPRDDQYSTSNDATRNEQSGKGRVCPRDFKNADPIGSVVFLRTRLGPLIAFGPRLEPVPPRRTDRDRVT